MELETRALGESAIDLERQVVSARARVQDEHERIASAWKEILTRTDDWDSMQSCYMVVEKQESELAHRITGLLEHNKGVDRYLSSVARVWKRTHPVSCFVQRPKYCGSGWRYDVERTGLSGTFVIFENDPFYIAEREKIDELFDGIVRNGWKSRGIVT